MSVHIVAHDGISAHVASGVLVMASVVAMAAVSATFVAVWT
jgi:hypothetical protein